MTYSIDSAPRARHLPPGVRSGSDPGVVVVDQGCRRGLEGSCGLCLRCRSVSVYLASFAFLPGASLTVTLFSSSCALSLIILE